MSGRNVPMSSSSRRVISAQRAFSDANGSIVFSDGRAGALAASLCLASNLKSSILKCSKDARESGRAATD